MRIFLIGYMGSGKTTLGKLLASRLGYTFIDQDDVIEEVYGMSISEVFSKFGEAEFRKTENKVLKDFEKQDKVVVSTGGGTPCFFDNMNIINAIGESLYLKITPGILASRLKFSKSKRPIIKDKTDEELLVFIQEKLNERDVFYSQAKHVVQGDDIKIEDLLKVLPPTLNS